MRCNKCFKRIKKKQECCDVCCYPTRGMFGKICPKCWNGTVGVKCNHCGHVATGEDNDLIVVCCKGPTCSGKTTYLHILIEVLKKSHEYNCFPLNDETRKTYFRHHKLIFEDKFVLEATLPYAGIDNYKIGVSNRGKTYYFQFVDEGDTGHMILSNDESCIENNLIHNSDFVMLFVSAYDIIKDSIDIHEVIGFIRRINRKNVFLIISMCDKNILSEEKLEEFERRINCTFNRVEVFKVSSFGNKLEEFRLPSQIEPINILVPLERMIKQYKKGM